MLGALGCVAVMAAAGAPAGGSGDGRGHDADASRLVDQLDHVVGEPVRDAEQRVPAADDGGPLRSLVAGPAQLLRRRSPLRDVATERN